MTRLVFRRFTGAVAATALVVLPGCVSLLPETEPSALYRLDTAPAVQAEPAQGAATVIVDRISAPNGLSGDRIAIQREGRIAYMAGAAWLSPAPVMVHGAVLDAFHAHAPAMTPARTEDGVAARYKLDLELRRFEAVYAGGQGAAPRVEVSLRAQMIDRDSRALMAARTVESTRAAAANRQGAIVDAFSSATREAAADLARWADGVVCDSQDPPPACEGG